MLPAAATQLNTRKPPFEPKVRPGGAACTWCTPGHPLLAPRLGLSPAPAGVLQHFWGRAGSPLAGWRCGWCWWLPDPAAAPPSPCSRFRGACFFSLPLSLGLQKMFLQVYGPMSCARCLLPPAACAHSALAFPILIFLLALSPPGPPAQGTHLFLYSHVLGYFRNNCTGAAPLDFSNR